MDVLRYDDQRAVKKVVYETVPSLHIIVQSKREAEVLADLILDYGADNAHGRAELRQRNNWVYPIVDRLRKVADAGDWG